MVKYICNIYEERDYFLRRWSFLFDKEDKMKKKLHELLTKETLTEKELDELEEDKEVTELNRLWASGLHAGFTWFDVVTRNNNRYDVYCKL